MCSPTPPLREQRLQLMRERAPGPDQFAELRRRAELELERTLRANRRGLALLMLMLLAIAGVVAQSMRWLS